MSRTASACLAVGAALCASSAATAIDFTFVELGVVYENVDESVGVSGSEGTALAALDGGYGFRAAGGFDIPLVGFFVDGEFSLSNTEFETILENETSGVSSVIDLDAIAYRLSGGYKFEAFDIAAFYGQIGVVNRGFNGDDATVQFGGETIAVSGIDADQDETGFEFEVGARAEVSPRIELTSSLRFTDVGSIEFPSLGEDGDLGFDDGMFGEAGIIYDLFGPAALRATYEFGDIDTAFFGLRAQF